MPPIDLRTLQTHLNFDFQDRSLLRRALTHRSYTNEHPDDVLEDNERLEFLGDAVLDFIAGEWLYNRFPEMHEGRMTRLRAALVRTETLAAFAAECHLGEALLLGRGEEDSGGRERQANLCRAFEAVVGAIYLDSGIDYVRTFVEPHFTPALDRILQEESDKDAKSRLQEWCQATLGMTPIYRTVNTTGPDHAKEFTIIVEINGQTLGQGTGRNKQRAAQKAARQALQRIQEESIFLEDVGEMES